MVTPGDAFVIEQGRKLLWLRASGVYEAAATQEKAVETFELRLQQELSAPRRFAGRITDVVGSILYELEDAGWIRRYTVCSGFDRRNGYQGLWDATCDLLAELAEVYEAVRCSNPAALELAAMLERLCQLQLWDGSGLPPLARQSRQTCSDARRWVASLEQDILAISTEVGKAQAELAAGPTGNAPLARKLSLDKAAASRSGDVQAPPSPGRKQANVDAALAMLDAALETAEADVHGLADAVVACRSRTDHMHEEQRQLLTSAEERLSEVLSASLEFATKGLNPTNLWVTWMRLFRLIQRAVDTGYEHLPALETAKSVAQELGLSLDYTMDIRKVGRAEPKVIEHFQRVFDATRHSEFMGQGPLKVQKVIEVHHESTRAEYLLKRKLLVEDCDSGPEVEAIHVKSQEFSWADALDLEHEPVDSRYNEFYLFHGTSPEIVEAITDTDFLIQRAPAHGHTFGRGVYLSEYVTHAQFFASEVCGGFSSGSIAILVCRAFCGRINDVGLWENTAQRHGKADEFERLLEDGTYHCTMGAEWPRWAECREFILADDDQVLPEFIVICTAEEKPDVDAEFVMVEGGT
eukprot:TRINITY_DN4152_c0_g1_i1.p1 TRINITY_DN4152_c0_g1~~TRINITY_DN4152_c0_g1_i1.p1  ORF type:complete len:580 (-),score=128.99 TRINITY_DN4152_c0_g1_i1:76-1815(-)